MEEIKIRCQGAGVLDLADMLAFQGELKSLSEEAYGMLRREILETGFAFPIHVWQDQGFSYILAGHQRKRTLEKMREEGYTIPPLPVIYVEATNYQEAKRRVLQDIAQYGKVEKQGLYEFMTDAKLPLDDFIKSFDIPIASLDKKSFSMEFFEDNTVDPKCDEDDSPEPPVEPKSKPGDLYQLGKHRLLCGDATMLDDYKKLMDGNVAHMVWIDPPYNVNYEGGTGLKIMNDSMSDEAFFQFLYDMYSNVILNVLPGSAIYVAHADSEGANFRSAMKKAGWLLKQCLIWVKSSFVMGRQDYHWQHEPILYGWSPGASHNWYSDRKQSTVLRFDKPPRNGEHPTMKPVELVEYCLNNSSRQNDMVLDCFGGSGTTLIACEKTGRQCFMLEKDPRYADVIVKRYENFTGKQAVLLTAT